jgi:DnaJ-class molecular chaperone
VDVRIPAGVKDGSRVRAAGEGESGANGGVSGDLYLRVRIKPHPVFERDGSDLRAKVAVPVTTAVLGGEAQVPTMTEEEMHDLFGNEDPFSDFFKTFFGGGGARDAGPRGRQARAPRTQKGRDIEHEVELTLEEAYHGATRRISIKQGGHARTVDVRLPAGVKDGSRVRAAGEGESGSNGGASGDLYLRVRIKPHPIFERDGNDLRTKVAVPVTTAVLGGEAQVPTIAGSVRLKIPETTQSGQVFRLKGHGMPSIGNPEQRGDLYATVEVQLPRSLSKDQRQHYEALSKLERS